jgi:hypothetical protein
VRVLAIETSCDEAILLGGAEKVAPPVRTASSPD